MRKKTLQAKLALVLSASMVLTMLAPATPARAADVDYTESVGANNLLFDFTSLTPSIKKFVKNVKIEGTSLNKIIEDADITGSGLDTDPANDYVFMPYINNTGAVDTSRTFEGKSLTQRGLTGYAIDGWYNAEQNGFSMPRLDIIRFQPAGTTYYLKLKPDTSKTYTRTVTHKAATGTSYVPSLQSVLSSDVSSNVMQSFQTVPKNISGFTATGVDVTIQDNFPIAQTDFKKDNVTKYVTGTTINKNFKVDYTYAVDPSKEFNVKVKDGIRMTSGGTLISNQTRPNNPNFNALAAVTGVAPRADLLAPVGTTGESRYILDTSNPVTIKYTKGDPNPTTFEFTSNTLIPAKNVMDGGNVLYEKLDFHPVAADGKSGGALKGQMVNQNVIVTYNYINNPNFYTTLRVKYVDAFGNDLGQKVADTLGITATAPSPSYVPDDFYRVTSGTDTILEVKSSGQNIYHVPVPVLPTYKDTPAPRIEAANPASWASAYQEGDPAHSGWTTAAQYYTVTANFPQTQETLIVTYVQDENSITGVSLSTLQGGKLMMGGIDYDPSQHSSHEIRLARDNVMGGRYDVTIREEDLATPVPDPGYSFATWTYGGNPITLPHTLNLPDTTRNIGLTATFTQNPSDWNTYHFVAGSPQVQLLNGSVAQLLNKDNSGNLRTITFDELQDYTTELHHGISVEPDFRVKWFDENLNEIDPTTDISQMSGKTFTAYAESTLPIVLNPPVADANLHPHTGVPTIAVNPADPSFDSRLKYVVTDPSGNVLAVIPGTELVRNGANITGPYLTPGDTYHLHTVDPAEIVTVGMPIPTTNVSTPTPVTVPVANTPQVTEDSVNPGRASITINPTSPNTEYALVDDMGNEVYPFTSPSGNTITFGNLDPDRIYHVIPRPVGSNDTPAARQAAGAHLPVDTSNLGLSVNVFDITIIANNAPMPTNFKINGVPTTDSSVLNGVAPGTRVEIIASLLDNNSNVFEKWQGITGITTTETNSRISFVMPNAPVKLQVVYDDGVEWDTQYNDSTGSGKNVGVTYPVFTETGKYRVIINKQRATNEVKDLVASTLSEEYKPLFMLQVVVQKEVSAGVWVDYVPTTGDVTLDTSIETGALVSTRDYMFHEIATSSNAVSQMSGDFENPSAGYTGQFDISLTSGRTYAFGYVVPQIYRVVIRDSRDNDLITNLVLRSSDAVQDKANLYSGRITGDYPDNNGVTWHYEGLSTDRNNFVDYDPSQRVTQDMTLYVFYSNDKVERDAKERELKAAVAAAKNRMSDYTSASQNQLRAQIQAAQAVLDRLNRKSTTAELQAALDALNALYSTLTLKSGGSSGGGTGGGTTGKKAGTKTSSGLLVGVDGNWQLIDENQHHWIFVMNNGAKVNGWNKLTYNYNGQTRTDWYYFNSDGIMRDGWFYDVNSASWYYLNEDHDGFFGRMALGWHHDRRDQKWYYMDPASGVMRTGWNNLSGEWYYLNPTAPAQTYFYDDVQKKWLYNTNSTTRPLGSMYENEATPDGYNVNASGAWVR